jgi:putative (di)nucleoside polyphosphate hydrolase
MAAGAEFFRAGVGAVITDGNGKILALERSDIPGAWQMVQGGLEDGEEPMEGVLREVEEETGILPSSVRLLDRYPEPLVYELPAAARSPKTGRGQVQYWFLFELTGGGSAIDLGQSAEFRRWRWMRFCELIDLTVSFRAPTYRKLADRFTILIAGKAGQS